ncbi:MAG: DUF1302 family protein [Rhizomicrobium sp.]
MPTNAHDRVRVSRPKAALILLAATLAVFPYWPLRAAELYADQGLSLQWDTTLRYSTLFRVQPRDNQLIDNPNTDDGDRNFEPGLVSNRLDVFSQADVDYGDFGLRVSGAGWYDSVYTGRNDNDSPATFNPLSVPHDAFTRATRALHAEHAELYDAFLHGSFSLGDMPVSFRLGRHALLWGESLFFPDNGIAAGQAPVDDIKAIGNPQATAAEILLPVTQASATFLPRPDIAIDLYYQFEWRKNRLPGSGSYFSVNDTLDAGGERFLLDNGAYLTRAGDLRPPDDDQFGAAVRFTEPDLSYGFYALRFDAKNPEIYLRPDGAAGPGDVGTYQLVYPRDIELYGASLSGYVADSNVAGELSLRRNMPLVSMPVIVAPGTDADAGEHARYALGNTLHAQVSSVSSFGAAALWDGATLTAELAASDILDITRNGTVIDPSRSRAALASEVSFAPEYFEVLPNLDISVPIGVELGLAGNSSTSGDVISGTGDVEIALEATFRNVWEARVSFTHFLGSPARQPLADRDFASISIQRTF